MTPEFFLYRDGTNIRIADMTRDQAIRALVEMIDDKRLRTQIGTKTSPPLVSSEVAVEVSLASQHTS